MQNLIDTFASRVSLESTISLASAARGRARCVSKLPRQTVSILLGFSEAMEKRNAARDAYTANRNSRLRAVPWTLSHSGDAA